MTALRTFLVLTAVFAAFLQNFHTVAAPAPQTVRLAGCGIEFDVPKGARIEKQGEDWILLRKSYGEKQAIQTARLILTCNANTRKTSNISEIQQEAEKRKQLIRYYRELQTDQGIRAAIYLKIRYHLGRKVISSDAYWATREREYRINLVPEKRKSEAMLEDHLPLNEELLRLLEKLRYTEPVRPAITEAEYQTRLNLALGLAGALLLLLTALAIKKIFKKKAPPVTSL